MARVQATDRQGGAQRTPQPQRTESFPRGSIQQGLGYGDVERGVGRRMGIEVDQWSTRA
jgi:hypothetical protein